eukprot:622211-Amphidinium_carterae.1
MNPDDRDLHGFSVFAVATAANQWEIRTGPGVPTLFVKNNTHDKPRPSAGPTGDFCQQANIEAAAIKRSKENGGLGTCYVKHLARHDALS